MGRGTTRALLVSLGLAGAACGPAGGPRGTVLALVADGGVGAGPDGGRPGGGRPDAGVDPACPDPTLASLAEKVFRPTCATSGCHQGDTPAEGLALDLEEAALQVHLRQASRQSPSGMPLVTPGRTGASYLYLKVAVASPLSGRRMPRDEAPLSECALDALAAWIETLPP
jgi:hypothetical protein